MSEYFFDQVQRQLDNILQELGGACLSSNQRKKYAGKAQALQIALRNEYAHTRQQLRKMEQECNRLRREEERNQPATPQQPLFEHYRHIKAAGGDAELIYRVAQQADVNRIERLKIIRTLFGYSLDEALTVEGRVSEAN